MQEAKGRDKHQQSQTRATKKHKPKKTTNTKQKPQPTPLPFAASETGETGETETTPSKKTVGPDTAARKQTFFTRENGITLTNR